MKKGFVICLSLLLALSLLGCGASKDAAAPEQAALTEGYYAYDEAPAEPAAKEEAGWNGATADMSAAPQNSKIIYTANMEMQTLTFEQAVEDITKAVEKTGGYFAESGVRGQGSGYRYANYIAKIPVAQFKSFMEQMGQMCHVTYSSTTAQDITDSYYDVDSRLTTAKTKLARLQELLAKADNMADIITIENAISDAEWQVENLSGTLKNYDAQVEYATVYMNLSEVYKLSGTEDAPVTFFGRIGNSFVSGLRSVGNFFEDTVVWLAYSWFYLLLLAAVVFGGIKLGKKLGKKRKARKEVS